LTNGWEFIFLVIGRPGAVPVGDDPALSVSQAGQPVATA
jgi:hypothetical protein